MTIATPKEALTKRASRMASSPEVTLIDAEATGFSAIEDIVADIGAGKMVIMVDDESRENEGDLTIAAELVRPEDINFMATHGRGLICLTLTKERCGKLELPLMVAGTDESMETCFTVSIDASEGVATGVSASDRALTIRTAVDSAATPASLRRPGHVFPLMAQPGGVLSRAGHTESGCDLTRLAGLHPAAVLVEVLNEDGSAARRPELEVFARKHGLRIGTIESLIDYRRRAIDATDNNGSDASAPLAEQCENAGRNNG